eukprot:2312079-Rhodomonas_salina.1
MRRRYFIFGMCWNTLKECGTSCAAALFRKSARAYEVLHLDPADCFCIVSLVRPVLHLILSFVRSVWRLANLLPSASDAFLSRVEFLSRDFRHVCVLPFDVTWHSTRVDNWAFDSARQFSTVAVVKRLTVAVVKRLTVAVVKRLAVAVVKRQSLEKRLMKTMDMICAKKKLMLEIEHKKRKEPGSAGGGWGVGGFLRSVTGGGEDRNLGSSLAIMQSE